MNDIVLDNITPNDTALDDITINEITPDEAVLITTQEVITQEDGTIICFEDITIEGGGIRSGSYSAPDFLLGSTLFIKEIQKDQIPEDRRYFSYRINAQGDVEEIKHQRPIEDIQNEIVNKVQDRLDSFARSKGYDGILSACTYATSNIVKFKVEGQYCVDSRDKTWGALYQILAEVQTGNRPIPSGYEDIEKDLPVLTWPSL